MDKETATLIKNAELDKEILCNALIISELTRWKALDCIIYACSGKITSTKAEKLGTEKGEMLNRLKELKAKGQVRRLNDDGNETLNDLIYTMINEG